jgi:hypothetical protein
MTDGTPGWFRDPNDDTLARWHDGKSWTEHTLVIADQPPGVEPTPPVIPEPEPEPEAADFTLHRRGVPAGRDLPGWAKVVAPLAVLALLVVGFVVLSGDDDTPVDETATAETVPASLDEAVRAARRAGLSDAVSDARAAALIERICGATGRPAAVDQLGEDLGELPADSPSSLRQQVGALGVGAEERCPEDLEDAPDLIDELQELAVVAFATTTTTTPVDVAADGGTDAGVTDAGDGDGDGDGTGTGSGRRTTTTRRPGSPSGSTATTAAPATTTTLPKAQQNAACSTPGARATGVGGRPLTCMPKCSSPGYQWRASPCPTNPPVPTTAPGQTLPSTTTTAGP